MQKRANTPTARGRHEAPVLAPLDLETLTVTELGALVDAMRDAQLRCEDAALALWREMRDLRLEVRSAFIRKFFEVRT